MAGMAGMAGMAACMDGPLASKVAIVVGSMPCGHDSGLVMPLMRLPRIAYRKSIKPSQIIPPSRQPAYQPGATISPLGSDSSCPMAWPGLDCALCSALPCSGFCAVASRHSRRGSPSSGSPSAPPQMSHGIVPDSCAIQPFATQLSCAHSGGPHSLLLCRLQARLSGIPHQDPGAESLIGTPSSLRFCCHRFPSCTNAVPRQLRPQWASALWSPAAIIPLL